MYGAILCILPGVVYRILYCSVMVIFRYQDAARARRFARRRDA